MLRQVAEGVRVHQSKLLQNNTVVVQGRAGVLLIDPGISGDEMACLANDIRDLDQPVVAGFATHRDWDHVLRHATLGCAPESSMRPSNSLSVNDAIGNKRRSHRFDRAPVGFEDADGSVVELVPGGLHLRPCGVHADYLVDVL
jgi:glyoxylase-like metal-dependent hydrolase (beta-lactamase superfamily II)